MPFDFSNFTNVVDQLSREKFKKYKTYARYRNFRTYEFDDPQMDEWMLDRRDYARFKSMKKVFNWLDDQCVWKGTPIATVFLDIKTQENGKLILVARSP